MRTTNLALMGEAEARADADFAAVVGTEIEVEWIYGIMTSTIFSVDLHGPWRVRVDKTRAEDLHHWNDEFLDPYWDITPVDGYPQLDGIRSFWTHGKSYEVTDAKGIVAAD